MLAELAVGHPGRAFLIFFEGEGVDQQRAAGAKLDIVGAGILEDHARVQRFFGDGEGQQGRVFELAEAPFVGVRNKGQLLRADHARGKTRFGRLNVHFIMRHQRAGLHQAGIQAGRHQQVVVLAVRLVDLAVKYAFLTEEESTGVAERCRNPVFWTTRHRLLYHPGRFLLFCR